MIPQGLKHWIAYRRIKWRTKYFAKFAFVHINKTGGVSVEKALGLPRQNHLTAAEYIAMVGEKRWKKLFTFTVVRNPWDRVVSHYSFRVKTAQTGLGIDPVPFAEWVRRTYGEQDPALFDQPKFFAPQLAWISNDRGEVVVDHVCRLENIDEDFGVVCERLGITAKLPHLNRSSRGPYQDYYDDESAEIVRRWFARDIERFDYSF